MKINAGENGNIWAGSTNGEGLIKKEAEQRDSPDLEKLGKRADVPQEIMLRAREREEEERDLRVLDAYNRFENGLQEMLDGAENGVMRREAFEAQSAVHEINDYFSSEGGRICDELPDDECRTLFMDILESRRKTAVDAVARYQSQQYQNWKERTARETIDSVLKGVCISPDAAALRHGELLLEGAVMRLYRGGNPELLELRLRAAKQAMYSGALESIAVDDPVTAIIVAEGWQEQLGEELYVQLKEQFEPKARCQAMKMEFYSLRELDGVLLKAELSDISDKEMRAELAQMIEAYHLREEQAARRGEADEVNRIFRELFHKYAQSCLTLEDIVDSGLEAEQRAVWREIFSNAEGSGCDKALLRIAELVENEQLSEEYEIYTAMTSGLGRGDAALLSTLINFKDNPEARLMTGGLSWISESCDAWGGDDRDHAAAIRDFLQRVTVRVGKGEPFSVTAVRNEVVKDHFEGKRVVQKKESPKINKDEFSEPE